MKTNNRTAIRRLATFASGVVLTVLCLFQPAAVKAQWTTPDANQNINNTNSGNVGIGTTTPTGLLEVKKSQSAGTTVTVDNPFTTSSNSAYSGFFFKQAGSNRLLISSINDNHGTLTPGTAQFWNFANGPTVFANNNTETMRISATGNLGIGVTAPTEKLHIRGTARFENTDGTGAVTFARTTGASGFPTTTSAGYPLIMLNRLYFRDASSGAPSSINALGTVDLNASAVAGVGPVALRVTGAADNNNATLQTRNAAGTPTVTILGTGSVGIGTITPSHKLHVQGGSVNASDGLCINGDCKTAWSQVGGSQWANGTASINYMAGKVGIGTATPAKTVDVVGDINATGTITGGNIKAKYQDVAEWVDSSQELQAGTVVVLDGNKSNQVIASTQAYDTSVAGVISMQPGLTLGEEGEGRVLVATTGRVKVKVDATNGPIKIGDLLVTSDREGFAMKSLPMDVGGARLHRPGTLIGKALEPLAKGTGEILVLLSLQ